MKYLNVYFDSIQQYEAKVFLVPWRIDYSLGPIDQEGEFLKDPPFLDKPLKDLAQQVIRDLRNNDYSPINPSEYWKIEEEIKRKEQKKDQKIQNDLKNYQRKILPWEQLEFDHESLKRVFHKKERSNLIICASLIDKISSLAGIARTSEIMNVEYLVINDGKIVECDEFKGISVTSEKWFPIYEVKQQNLKQYLQFQKSKNGYTIIGIERSNNNKVSIPIQKFTFPKKSIILVGDEIEGLPAEYLAEQVDQIIQIPQEGFIKTINVHVQVSISIWEYVKQHMPGSNASERKLDLQA